MLSCRTLRISEFDDRSNSFLSLLGFRSSGYEKVAVINCNFHDTAPLQMLVSNAGKTIRRLQITVPPHGEFNWSVHDLDALNLVGPADAPILSLAACETLEQIFVTVVGTNASFQPVAHTLSSVTSRRFQKFILEFRTTARRDPDSDQVKLIDRLSQLDGPLSQTARVALEEKRKVSLIILAQDPEFLAQGFMDFRSFGCVWAGEEIGGGEYLWSLTTPKKVRRSRVTALNRLFRQKASDDVLY